MDALAGTDALVAGGSFAMILTFSGSVRPALRSAASDKHFE
jgi:hypothetical protein